jgi:hypothetical protein
VLICEFNLRIIYYDSIEGVDAAIYLDATKQLLEEAAMEEAGQSRRVIEWIVLDNT